MFQVFLTPRGNLHRCNKLENKVTCHLEGIAMRAVCAEGKKYRYTEPAITAAPRLRAFKSPYRWIIAYYPPYHCLPRSAQLSTLPPRNRIELIQKNKKPTKFLPGSYYIYRYQPVIHRSMTHMTTKPWTYLKINLPFFKGSRTEISVPRSTTPRLKIPYDYPLHQRFVF